MWEKNNLLNGEFIMPSILPLQNWLEQERFKGPPSSGDPVERRASWERCCRAGTGPLRGAHTLQELEG